MRRYVKEIERARVIMCKANGRVLVDGVEIFCSRKTQVGAWLGC